VSAPAGAGGSKSLYCGQPGYLIDDQCPLVEGAALLSVRWSITSHWVETCVSHQYRD